MPEHLRALVVILVLAVTVFKLAERPLTAAAISLRDYRRRRNLWFAITLIAFFSHNFWVYLAVAGAVIFHFGRRDRNPFALYCMREEAAAAVRGLPDLRVASQGRVSLARFFEELRQSKVCFSPIGYGEVCWRDFEAVMCGALLIKPDVGHLRITPDIFRAGETYAPVRWDLADFDEVVRGQLADVRGRERIAQQAFDVVSSYIRAGAFVTELAPVFS